MTPAEQHAGIMRRYREAERQKSIQVMIEAKLAQAFRLLK